MVSNHNTLKGLQVEHGFYIALLKEQRDFLTFIGPSHCFTFSKIRWILKETYIYIYSYIICLSMPPKLAKHIISKHFQSILILINISLPRPRRNSPFRNGGVRVKATVASIPVCIIRIVAPRGLARRWKSPEIVMNGKPLFSGLVWCIIPLLYHLFWYFGIVLGLYHL